MQGLTPEAVEIFSAAYAVPDELWLRVFFTPSTASQAAGRVFLERFRRRTEGRDPQVADTVAGTQVAALAAYNVIGADRYSDLPKIKQPTLVVNGDNDVII